MYNQPQPALTAGPGRTKSQPVTARTEAGEHERPGNEHIRELLKAFGLRTSLIRLKVIDALHMADRDGRSIGVRGVHSQLEQLDIPLSFLSVREVLKRLCAEGVISLGNDKCYSLNPQARAVLEQATCR
ncbi:fe2+ zn2+ uptake regulation protein [Pseudomonas sp. NPDC087612]|uniref:Fe2+ zn2+ uptake regulation protein n=1 Tax=Pseudomonas vranovensis TaxID=321661 RepID=A0A423CYT8_9PSED|nr:MULTISPECIES: fe2+ zn2+ uptake regulation protein [Pseudomonas]KJK14799.1 fe2+ zn2+ uptake regulation protein [Pseudomonas sp. 2(2015)]QPG61111.1 fe2+ zn2+ uptake regulation protein [Pseudomonas sp. BIGb0427]QVM94972.1 fe2+ zn2+ uptake regulation protein [Pseudomonas sp. SORT22]ROL64522.1 fe2+ zn2+ uptake regulation protein [Pseudomonas vranovensis]UVL58166.1 fe2+ zn2+ uptake regulation protein [Pseudomonas sp. B21-035]